MEEQKTTVKKSKEDAWAWSSGEKAMQEITERKEYELTTRSGFAECAVS